MLCSLHAVVCGTSTSLLSRSQQHGSVSAWLRRWQSEVFYFPQDTPESLGPTEIMPGTHHRKNGASEEAEGLLTAGPAGTLAIHHQSILHRRARQYPEADGVYRHMLK